DVCLRKGQADGLVFLEHLRREGFRGRAFVLTAMSGYDVESAADALGARYVPKEKLNAVDLVSRVLDGASLVPAESPSSVRLNVSRDEVATYLAQDPEGLHAALARIRGDVVRKVVGDCAGNRTEAGRRLRLSR